MNFYTYKCLSLYKSVGTRECERLQSTFQLTIYYFCRIFLFLLMQIPVGRFCVELKLFVADAVCKILDWVRAKLKYLIKNI